MAIPLPAEHWTTAYAALGSNQGDRLGLLTEALRRLDRHERIRVVRLSRVYETDPVGYTDQPAFLNMAVRLETTLSPVELLRAMLAIEQELGRVRTIRNGPRTIDLDLLYVQGESLHTEELTLPHPRMMERAFVLVPLCEVTDAAMPLKEAIDKAAQEALAQGKEGIALWNTINWHSASALFEN